MRYRMWLGQSRCWKLEDFDTIRGFDYEDDVVISSSWSFSKGGYGIANSFIKKNKVYESWSWKTNIYQSS